MSRSRIADWIAEITSESSSHQEHEGTGPAKRRRLNPPTPDPSDSPMSAPAAGDESPGKRKQGADGAPSSLTKRSRNFQSEYGFPPSDRSATGLGRLSPTKQFQLYKMQPNGPDFKDLAQLRHKPKSLSTLLNKIDTVMDGISIISSAEKTNLDAAADAHDIEFDWLEGRDYSFSETRDDLGPTPSIEWVMETLDSAVICNSEHEHEASWNQDVHAPVLKFAFRKRDQRLRDQFIRIKNCVNGSILPEYQSAIPGPSKKVDFCVHICPENEPCPQQTAHAIQHLAGQLPGLMFNFMNVVGLQHQPVAIGIETKKPSEGFDVAKLQLGVWQASHWAFLRTLVKTQQENEKMTRLQEQVEEQNLAARYEHNVQPSAEREETDADFRYKLPDFLPGVIINGHEWWLTISTLESSRVQLYEKRALGSTKDTKDIYKLVCALQVLRQWVEESYWPWLKELVLLC